MSETVLLVDDDDEFRESMGEVLRDGGFDVLLAASAPQALENASRHNPAMCLLDVAMPTVDGIQLLRYFRSRKLFRHMPVIVMTAGMKKSEVRQVLQLGVKDVMLKSRFSIQELLDRIHKRLNQAADPGQTNTVDTSVGAHNSYLEYLDNPPSGFDSSLDLDFQNDSFKDDSNHGVRSQCVLSHEMINAIGTTRALPAIVEQLLEVFADPDPDLAEFRRVVAIDHALAASIVKQANSGLFGQREATIERLDEAIDAVGFANVLRIAAASAILRRHDFEGEAGGDLATLWRTSLATGLVAEALAQPTENACAFLQGVLRDLPSIFALQYLGSDWLQWKSHGLVKGWSLREILSNALGAPIESMAGQILDAYRIPAEVASLILEFHDSLVAIHPPELSPLVKRVEFARMLACTYGRFGTVFSEIRALSREEAKIFGLETGYAQLAHEIATLEAIAYLPEMADDLPNLNREVVMWRDSRWSDSDPIEAVLQRSTDCICVAHFEDLATQNRVRVAVAEPGSLEWERLGNVAPVIALHRGTLRPGPLPPGVEALRMPFPIHRLLHKIEKASV